MTVENKGIYKFKQIGKVNIMTLPVSDQNNELSRVLHLVTINEICGDPCLILEEARNCHYSDKLLTLVMHVNRNPTNPARKSKLAW